MSRTVDVVAATPGASGWTCTVRIGDGGRSSDHVVGVTQADMERLGGGSSVEELVRRSFDFLLGREPPQSILRQFALSDIERYFPEYPQVITRKP